ncbi:hypothetical protein BH10BAC3_BH10BAC3_16420 [soil metagenome]
MKKFYILIVFALQFSLTSNAKIWRVNNIAGITADFTTLQAAHDGAAVGDTIHLEPSVSTYGDLTMSKRLSIISTGGFANSNPGYQQDFKQGFAGNITISNPLANGSLLSIRFAGAISISTNTVGNITLLHCASTSPDQCTTNPGALLIVDADNIIVSQGWFATMLIRGSAQNILIKNNIIGNKIQVLEQASAIIVNNVICAITADQSCSSNGPVLINSTVTNNIFLKGTGNSNFGGSLLQNNFSTDASLPAGNGNIGNVNMLNIFVNGTGVFVDNAYVLKAGSLAIGAGLNGEDLGAFGGTTPFRLAVTPSIPSIYKLAVPSAASGGSMNIIFSTRTNN